MRKLTISLLALAAILTFGLVAKAQLPGVNSTLQSIFTIVYDASTSKPTYSSTQTVPGATSSGIFCALTGSATKTVRVRRVIIGGNATAVETIPVVINKYSTFPTAGAGQAMLKIAYDSTQSAATAATAEYWSTSPTAGTLVGTLADIFVGFPNTTTGTNTGTVTYSFGGLGSPVFLRGVAQTLTVGIAAGTNFTSGSFNCTFEWTEDTDF